MATTKCLFTLPAKLVADLEQLTSNERGVGVASILSRAHGRFSRDRFISDVLRDELPRLQGLTANSQPAFRLLRDDMLQARRRGKSKPVNIVLESTVAKRLGELCEAKRVPRDLLVQEFLEHVVNGLSRAREVANAPTGPAWEDGAPYSRLYVSPEDVVERNECNYVIEALASRKGVGFGVAQRAYWRLPRDKRRVLRNEPRIKAATAALKAQAGSQVDLAEYLPLADQRARRIQSKQHVRKTGPRKTR